MCSYMRTNDVFGESCKIFLCKLKAIIRFYDFETLKMKYKDEIWGVNDRYTCVRNDENIKVITITNSMLTCDILNYIFYNERER